MQSIMKGIDLWVADLGRAVLGIHKFIYILCYITVYYYNNFSFLSGIGPKFLKLYTSLDTNSGLKSVNGEVKSL